MVFMHMIDLIWWCLWRLDFLLLAFFFFLPPFSLFIPSFLLVYHLLWTRFSDFVCVFWCRPRARVKKGRRRLGLVFALFLSFFLSIFLFISHSCLSLCSLAEQAIGGGFCVSFFFSFCSLDSIFKITLIANLSPINSCLLVLPKPCVWWWFLLTFLRPCWPANVGSFGFLEKPTKLLKEA